MTTKEFVDAVAPSMGIPDPDILIENSGSGFFSIYANTTKGREWLDENVPDAEDGRACTDDRRLAMDIAEGAERDGLAVA